jgi:ribonuclease E
MSISRILIDAVYPDETRVVIYDNNKIQAFDYETASKKQTKGNIYLARITRVEPSLQAAFVEYGENKHGFLPFSEIHPAYYSVAEEVTEENDVKELSSRIKAITPPEIIAEEELPVVKTLEEDINQEVIVQDYNHSTEDSIPVYDEYASPESANIDANPPIEDEDESENSDFLVDDQYEFMPRRENEYKQHKIQEVIKRNQVILVQVIKEERGNKGASLTSYLSLAGRYCVLMPNSSTQGGISKKISDHEDRKRLKSIIEELTLPEGASVIVRTAGANRSKTDIKRDYDYLVRLWNSIREHTLNSKAPTFIHAEGDLIRRCIRDLYDSSVDEILIQGEKAFQTARDFMKMVIPSHAHKVKLYNGKVPLFCKHQIEEQLGSLYNPTVTLQSGGYIVINPTEALIAIDVNSGRSTSEKNVEETATKTNLEAAREIARQIRLRDLSGLIVVDFIDMSETRNRRTVERALRDAVYNDRAKIQLGYISNFGLLEMSRQRLRPSFLEANTVPCFHCSGKGTVRAAESTAIMMLRTIESEICRGDFEAIHIYATADTVVYILNHKRTDIATIEQRYNIKVLFHTDIEANTDSFSIERVKRTTHSSKASLTSLTPFEDYIAPEESPIIVENEPKPQQSSKKRNWRKTKSSSSPSSDNTEEMKSLSTMPDITLPKIEPSANKRDNKDRHHNRNSRRKPSNKERNYEPQYEEALAIAEGELNTNTNYANSKNNKRRKPAPNNRVREKKKTETTSLLKDLWKRIIE